MSEESDRPPRDDDEKKRLIERIVPELVKKLVDRAVESGVEKFESGVERLSEGPEGLRHLVGELKLPKEVIRDIYAQIDDTKVGLYRVVAKEIRDVLQHTELADEITKVLTKLSFEIKTEIRFIPNDAQAGSESASDDSDDDNQGQNEVENKSGSDVAPRRRLPKPSIKAEVKMKDRNKAARRDRRGPEDA